MLQDLEIDIRKLDVVSRFNDCITVQALKEVRKIIE